MRQVHYALQREQRLRESDHLYEIYGVDAYLTITGDDPPEGLREKIGSLLSDLSKRQDWAIMGPERIKDVNDRHAIFYYNLQGAATYNRWLAGTIACTRIARRYGWEEESSLALYLTAKLAMARIAHARYVDQMYRMGMVRGEAQADNRTVIHADATCVILGRGPMEQAVHQNQELPPFNDLTEPVGRLLGRYARAECRTYLDHLDQSVPLWYISEAPKQTATEHRTCPLQYGEGNVLAQYWILGKRGDDFARYVDTTRFKGDLYYIRRLSAALNSYNEVKERP